MGKIFFKSYQIVVFDDMNKKRHKCHFIIDSKWTAENTEKDTKVGSQKLYQVIRAKICNDK